jgi:hypothetical protein
MKEILSKFEKLAEEFDCGGNPCLFSKFHKNPGGMRTNAGCHCLDYPNPKQQFLMRQLFRELMKELEKEKQNGE